MIVHRKMKKIHPIFDFSNKEKYLAQDLGHFVPSKKGLNIIGSKIALQYSVYLWALLKSSISLISLLAPLCSVVGSPPSSFKSVRFMAVHFLHCTQSQYRTNFVERKMSAVFNPTLSAPPTDGLFSLWLLSHSSSEGEGAKLFTRTNSRPIIPHYLCYPDLLALILITTKDIVLDLHLC